MTRNAEGGRRAANHLMGEKSPYLQQHAHNPVDWYPWGEEAFRRAAAENRPVFLSIGYATCHWCHVMAHESFEDPAIARLLDAGFIAVKVDREERPDIDSVYMTACQQMTGQGGWPLTILMTPDRKPFFAGTYLPVTSRAGMMGLTELLTRVIHLWETRQDRLREDADHLTALLSDPRQMPVPGTVGTHLPDDGYTALAASFDPLHGGFGRAPKFPSPSTLLFLLRYMKQTRSDHARHMAEQTLESLQCGGIHDHLGGGFHRYATDAAWQIPHFEKMLSDQALLLMAYTEAWLATGNPAFRTTAEGITGYVTRDLLVPPGVFIAAEDADSAGGEGSFYLWTREELESVLGARDAADAAALFGVTPEGNFREGGYGKSILHLTPPVSPRGTDQIRQVTVRLLAARSRRPRPERDTKILTDWNCLMIAALARASRAFSDPSLAGIAATAMRYILRVHRAPDGGLYHRSCDGEAGITGFADDYASAVWALIELYEATFEPCWLRHAIRLTTYLNAHFRDPDGGGLFTTADNGDRLIMRKKEIFDSALPSANALALSNLVRLGRLTGNPVYEGQASALADFCAGSAHQAPAACPTYLFGLCLLFDPPADVVIAGEREDPVVQEMLRELNRRYLPGLTLHLRTDRSAEEDLFSLAPFTKPLLPRGGKAAAYVCTGRTCSPPVMDAVTLAGMADRIG